MSGFIRDAESGEGLPGSYCFCYDRSIGVVADSTGAYSVLLPVGPDTLVIAMIGYEKKTMPVVGDNDLHLDHYLQRISLSGQTVEVQGSRFFPVLAGAQGGEQSILVKNLRVLPTVLGEKDLLKLIQLLPGVESGSEDSNTLYVRGGAPDQNLILLDGMTIQNPDHLLGFFSIFNPDVLSTATLIKGGIPAQYGGRISSVLNLEMKEGDASRFHGNAALSLLSGQFSLEGPAPGKGSFIVSGRRSYYELIGEYLRRNFTDYEKAQYSFYDLYFKSVHRPAAGHRLSLSAYHGRDRGLAATAAGSAALASFENSLHWGNSAAILNWDYLKRPHWLLHGSISAGKYSFDNQDHYRLARKDIAFSRATYQSTIAETNARLEAVHLADAHKQTTFGVTWAKIQLTPTFQVIQTDSAGVTRTIPYLDADKSSAVPVTFYAEHQHELGARWKISAGIHFAVFNARDTTFFCAEPRLSLRYRYSTPLTFKASYSRLQQYEQMLAHSNLSMISDIRVLADNKIPAAQCDQWGLGAYYEPIPGLSVSSELYYKGMRHILEFHEEKLTPNAVVDWRDLVDPGSGYIYGLEIMAQKTGGQTTGWISYTTDKVKRSYQYIDRGTIVPYAFEQRHSVHAAMARQFSERFDLSVIWLFQLGHAMSLGPEKFTSPGWMQIPGLDAAFIIINDAPSSRRVPVYHRLEINGGFHFKTSWDQHILRLGLFNAFSRRYEYVKNAAFPDRIRERRIFTVIPTIGYRIEF